MLISKDEIRHITAIEFITFFIYIVTALIALVWWNRMGATSIAIGGTIVLVNFDLSKRILLMIIEGPAGAKMFFGLLYLGLFGALVVVLFIVVVKHLVDPIGLAVGVSALFAGITSYAVYRQIRSMMKGPHEEFETFDDDWNDKQFKF